MNMDKRYCQNRGRKRKRTIVPHPVEYKNISPAEEERQFKLRRFVEDLDKFMPQKESCPDEKIIPKRYTSNQERKAVKNVTIPNPTLKRGLYQNGIQTKFYTRGGVTAKEITARLDENMQKIISLGNNNQCNQCTHHCKGQISQSGLGSPKWGMEHERPPVLEPLLINRLSSTCDDVHLSPSPHSGLAVKEQVATISDGSKSLAELDKDLYPLFTRVVSVSCTRTKTSLFKNLSYVSSVKRKLLEIHINGIDRGKRELNNCLLEPQKATSSVGTSPLSSSKTHSPLHKRQPFKLEPSKYRFKSTMEYLEEKIGPISTSSSKQIITSPQYCQPYFESDQLHSQHSLLSPPIISYQRPQQSTMYVPKLAKHMHEPLFPSTTPVTSLYNVRSKVVDGRGDGFHFNCFNSFLPPIEEDEEDSPDFRYYPRKVF